MLMTENVRMLASASPLEHSDSASTMVGEGKKPRKSVCFSENVATVVAYVDLGQSSDIWHSKLDLKLFKEKAKALSEHLHQSQPMLAREIEDAHAFTRAHKEEGSDKLFTKWHKLSSGRRGLERFVLDKHTRQHQVKEVKASRSVVLNLQCLFRRSSGGAKLTDQQAEMIRQQYFEFTRPAVDLAKIYATKDAAAVKPYYKDQDEQDEEEEEDIEDFLLDDGVLSVGSSSVSSGNSKSAKKVKKRSEKDSSSSSLRKKSSSSKKSSSKKSSKTRTKSPIRRMRSMDSPDDFDRRAL